MIMATFQKVKLGDIITKIIGGGTPSKSNPSYWNGSLPWASVKDLSDNKHYLDSTEDFITEEGLQNSASNLISKGTVVLPTRMGLGRVVKTKIDTTINQDLKALIPNEKITNDFLLCSLVFAGNKLRKLGTVATVMGIRIEDLKSIEIDLPDLSTQSCIASVLSAYDDLIENNEKRIKALEEMAQLLYTEWFVKFKFPGHEKVKMVDSGTEYGLIPEGWEVKTLKDVGKAVTGKTPPTENVQNFDGDILFIKTPDIHGNLFVLETEQTLSEIGARTQSLKLLPEKTVFISCIGTLGVVGITSKPSQTNQQINALILNDSSDYCFFYLFAKSLKHKLVGLGSNGATMGNVNKDKFENINIIYPTEKTRNLFFKVASNLFDEILLLQKNNKKLSKTRDLLIPQLVTGKRILKQ